LSYIVIEPPDRGEGRVQVCDVWSRDKESEFEEDVDRFQKERSVLPEKVNLVSFTKSAVFCRRLLQKWLTNTFTTQKF
jgi:hypothetical protein